MNCKSLFFEDEENGERVQKPKPLTGRRKLLYLETEKRSDTNSMDESPTPHLERYGRVSSERKVAERKLVK